MIGLLAVGAFAAAALVWLVWLCREVDREQGIEVVPEWRIRMNYERDLLVIATRAFREMNRQVVITRQALLKFNANWARQLRRQMDPDVVEELRRIAKRMQEQRP